MAGSPLIRRLAVLFLLLLPAVSRAQEEESLPDSYDSETVIAEGGPTMEPDAPAGETPSNEREPDDSLSKHRTRFDVLTDRTIGTVSRPVQFNWRRTKVHIAGMGSFLSELNAFNSYRGGLMLRFPSGKLLFETSLTFVGVGDSTSSSLLALTPYRQPGRPNRFDVDAALVLPVAEGVVTAFPRWFPAVQMSFNLIADFRYSAYPWAFSGMRPGRIATAILSPSLTEAEIDNLDRFRLAAMEVDPARYGVLVGAGNDIYFKQGFYVSPRLMLAIPLFAAASGSDLLFYTDFTLAVGVAL